MGSTLFAETSSTESTVLMLVARALERGLLVGADASEVELDSSDSELAATEGGFKFERYDLPK